MRPGHSAEKYSRRAATTDIIVVVLASAVFFGLEVALAGYLPWGEEARGVSSVLVGATLALWLTYFRRRPLSDLGFGQPVRWRSIVFWIIGIVFAYVIIQNLTATLLQQFFEMPAPDMSRYESIKGNLPGAVLLALVLPLTASIPEEIIYRGFLVERLSCLTGQDRKGWVLAVLAQAVLFGLVHFQWGPGGILMTLIMGLVWGFAYLLCGRNLWTVITAHSTLHIAFVAQLYAG